MSEYSIGYLACGSLAGLVIAAVLYMMGGRDNKALRRYGASAIIAATINIVAWLMGVWFAWLLLIFPLKIAEFSLGYGGDDSLTRGFKRALVVGVSLLSGLIFCVTWGGVAYWYLALQAFVGAGTIFFAFKNPIAAAAEEPLVCVLNNCVLMLYPFIVTI